MNIDYQKNVKIYDQLALYKSMLVRPFSRSNKYKSLNAIKCLSPPKMYIFYLFTTTLCPSLAQGFFPIITLRESSYIIYCFKSFFETY